MFSLKNISKLKNYVFTVWKISKNGNIPVLVREMNLLMQRLLEGDV